MPDSKTGSLLSTRLAFAVILSLLFSTSIYAAVTETQVSYADESGQELNGFLYQDSSKMQKGGMPGVIVIPDWKGVGKHAQDQAKKLAEFGYVTLVADIYGKGVRPQTNEEAGKLAGKYKSDIPLLRRRANAALVTIRKWKSLDKTRIAVIGYCFGGTTALELARGGADIKAVVSLHGGLKTPNPNDAKNIKSEILVLHGADDPNVPPPEVQAFKDEMNNAKVKLKFIEYKGAVHSFTNPEAGNDKSKGAAYNEKAAKQAFQEMKDFFIRVL